MCGCSLCCVVYLFLWAYLDDKISSRFFIQHACFCKEQIILNVSHSPVITVIYAVLLQLILQPNKMSPNVWFEMCTEA